jgi:hypothetical protein
MYYLQTSLGTNPSIGFVRIEIVLVTQYCHYYESSKFWQHHQITLSMITPNWEHSINHNSIVLQFSHRTDLPNFFYLYPTFLQFVHSLTFHAFFILCVAQIMANCKVPLACLSRRPLVQLMHWKSNFLVCILNYNNL